VLGGSRGVQRPVRVAQMGSGERAEIGSFRRQDRVDLIGGGDVADRHRPDADLLANAIGKRRLEHAAVDRCLLRHGLATRDIDQVDAVLLQRARDRDGVVSGVAAVRPVGGGDADRHRLVRGPARPHGIEDFERKSQAVFNTSAVLIRPNVRERREERAEQIAVSHVDLEQVEARLLRPVGGVFVALAHRVHVRSGHRSRGRVARLVRDRRRREELPGSFRVE
jgi:hypothetical protein